MWQKGRKASMRKLRKSCVGICLALALALTLLGGCAAPAQGEDIVILYTNDVHGAVDTDIGYAGLAAYRQQLEEKTPYVTLVDCGDALQGDTLGAVSQGEYLMELMNLVEYDFAVLGNHEFDYGMEQLKTLLEQADAQYLGCNIRYTGSGESAVSALKPYEIVDYGGVQVAFLGISTPESIAKSTPAYFMDDAGQISTILWRQRRGVIWTGTEHRRGMPGGGADYVVALAPAPFRSTDVIAATTGIDVVLDGHSHSVIPCDIVKNKDGKDVLLSSTGTGLINIGQLVITAGGNLTVGLIGTYPEADEAIAASIHTLQGQYEEALAQVMGHTEVTLTTEEEGIRLIRNRETNLGDFCADAYRAVAGADIALVNGGGIRADLNAGDVTYGDILAVHPYGNTLCVVEATGQEILDALEMGSRATLAETGDGESAIGESGGFLQVSGLRYTIDTSVESTVEVDEAGMFVSCGEERRVRDVQVLQEDGSYAPIDAAETYTVASHSYLIKEGGDGLNMFWDNTLTIDGGMMDYEILITYLEDILGGTIGEEYATPQGRINVV